MTKYEKFYTKELDMIIKEIVKIKQLLPKKIQFIDTSCGNNKLVKKLLDNHIISDYISYDISPQKDYYGIVIIDNWLKENGILEKNIMVGFNPPYGFGSKTAKKFIYKGYEEKYNYCLWLVPISLKSFLNKLYIPLIEKQYISMEFYDKNDDNNDDTNMTIKQSVLLFLGKRKKLSMNMIGKILSEKKIRIKSKYDYILKRTHNKGIRADTTVLLKKTGNPVFFPSFYRTDISKNIWIQVNKTGIVSHDAYLEEKNGKYVMNGKHITKYLNENYKYAVDSNIYVKLSGLEKWIDIEKLMERLKVLGNTTDFFNIVNKYKPAAITIGWLREFLNEYIADNKIENNYSE
jgi:hypothetical protein